MLGLEQRNRLSIFPRAVIHIVEQRIHSRAPHILVAVEVVAGIEERMRLERFRGAVLQVVQQRIDSLIGKRWIFSKIEIRIE